MDQNEGSIGRWPILWTFLSARRTGPSIRPIGRSMCLPDMCLSNTIAIFFCPIRLPFMSTFYVCHACMSVCIFASVEHLCGAKHLCRSILVRPQSPPLSLFLSLDRCVSSVRGGVWERGARSYPRGAQAPRPGGPPRRLRYDPFRAVPPRPDTVAQSDIIKGGVIPVICQCGVFGHIL